MRRMRSTSPRTTRRRRNSCRSIPMARFPPSSIPRGRTASRSRCSNRAPYSPISAKSPADSCRRMTLRAIRRCNGSSSRSAVSDRCSASLDSSTSLPAKRSRTSDRSSAIATKRSAFSAYSTGSLQDQDYLVGAYTIADIATFPWVRSLRDFYGAGDLVGFDGFTNVAAWLDRCLVRPAVQIGLNVPPRE